MKGQSLRAKTGNDRSARPNRDGVFQERGGQRRQFHMPAILEPRISGRQGGGPTHDPAQDSFTAFAASSYRHAANRSGDEAGSERGRIRSIRHKWKLIRNQFARGEKHEDITVGGSGDDRRSGERAQSAYRAYGGLASIIHLWIVAL
jgi:hypothetical protein